MTAEIKELRPRTADAGAFSGGDIVRLKSGSPMMTVRHVGAQARGASALITVDWFAEAERCAADFHSYQLENDDGTQHAAI